MSEDTFIPFNYLYLKRKILPSVLEKKIEEFEAFAPKLPFKIIFTRQDVRKLKRSKDFLIREGAFRDGGTNVIDRVAGYEGYYGIPYRMTLVYDEKDEKEESERSE